MTETRAQAITGVIAGTATTTAYLAGLLVGHLTRHQAPVGVLALAITAAHVRKHHPRRWTAPGTTTA
ncbi:hypothetical protein ACWT_6167 [Actinoplanes sp. SE50]|uniref:hypothetical protein n=1 Tax=unclassified Actinoplanes TaxID=2626549 RepID=UPI00023ECD6C|nr:MULTISPECIES: hypothetical protein [unclassified Actinoplanes]AEV87181.1 hypothetical protein ACPL_6299 [Actinoplanes sp. SE50/110]ATO85582.1 hypothetical protein ACWT_6167 [Actinoplanes sp. SE50]SLM02995.1 hypothetical protein ACSP50_6280 [Actinoplanes sp. SE50/110]